MRYILGISSYYHDSAAALLDNGLIVAAAQEERFTRNKHDSSFPINAIEYCIREAEITFSELDKVVFYDKPFLKFERLIETYIAHAPIGFNSFARAIPLWIKEKLFLKDLLLKELKAHDEEFKSDNLLFSEHHLSHSASAFFASPFKEAVVLTLDGVGEWTTSSVSLGYENTLKITKEIHYPHSLGLLYSAFTYYLGFKVNSGEYKVMGLAPYGNPIFKETIINNLIDLKEDGSFRLDQKYFNYSKGLTMTNKKFESLFGRQRRKPESSLDQFHMDIAASIQTAIEDIVLKIIENLSQTYKLKNLCLAGGVALNCVANGKIKESNFFKNVWVQPASGDAGGALGAALAAWHIELNQKRNLNKDDHMQGSYLGPKYSSDQIIHELDNLGAVYQKHDEDSMIEIVADELIKDSAVGWFQGRMEFGPRSLGARSIIANPMSKSMQKNLNLKVKFRESFRPFAPSVLYEKVSNWFNIDYKSPYMLFVGKVKEDKLIKSNLNTSKTSIIDRLNIVRSKIPAVTHIDNTARVQTVHKDTNPLFHKLISKFESKSNCPILVNTSFNVRGEPIVCSPTDAFNCFMGTNLDILVIGNYVLRKNDQNQNLLKDYKNKYQLD